MTNLPTKADLNGASATQGEFKTAIGDLYDVLAQQPGSQAATEFTISSGSITPTVGLISVDTEADAASDNLDNISAGSLNNGSLLFLHAEHDDRTVNIRHNQGGSGDVITIDGATIALDDSNKWVILWHDNANDQWVELFRNFTSGATFDPNSAIVAGSLIIS